MTLIRATCTVCGDIELRSRDIEIRIPSFGGAATYVFQCPDCQLAESKLADDQIIDILASANCRITEWSLPKELEELHFGDPISHDDVLDFHNLLESDNWVQNLADAIEF